MIPYPEIMIKNLFTALTVSLFLMMYYYLCYISFIKKYPFSEFPALRARWGTMMHHSSDGLGKYAGAVNDPNAVEHIYCYWPRGDIQYFNKGGEYIIKRQDDGNCDGWFGKAIMYEGWWVSEREKLWWSLEQKLEEDLKTAKMEMHQI